ncbi:hypothetical protein M8J75_009541 [Diaphorina citri]|nr:hypothetical protein M8J75_009541 [Diaphorina citri]
MAGTPQSLTMKLYQAVIADVINNVKEAFQEEGVDEQVLQELKHIWEAKLVSSKALESVETETETHKLPDQKTVQVYQQPRQQTQQQQPQQSQPPIQQQQQPVKHQQAVSQHQQVPPPPQQQQAPNSNMNSLAQDLNKKIPIQITLPAQHGSTNREGRVVTIQVPASTLQGNQLQSVLGGRIEDEPLNSSDDVSEEDPALFDTDNIVVCQYDKITRSRNKWKFYLKDGIMNLNGKDFVFLKANGDADW